MVADLLVNDLGLRSGLGRPLGQQPARGLGERLPDGSFAHPFQVFDEIVERAMPERPKSLPVLRVQRSFRWSIYDLPWLGAHVLTSLFAYPQIL
jgi:hypothetical protein